jgi:hypothetical protein
MTIKRRAAANTGLAKVAVQQRFIQSTLVGRRGFLSGNVHLVIAETSNPETPKPVTPKPS